MKFEITKSIDEAKPGDIIELVKIDESFVQNVSSIVPVGTRGRVINNYKNENGIEVEFFDDKGKILYKGSMWKRYEEIDRFRVVED